MKLPAFCLFFCALFSTALTFSQDIAISGFLEDQVGRPMAYTNVILFKAQDSVLVKGISTTEKGFFILDKLVADAYFLKFSYLGYTDVYKAVIANKTLDLGRIVLQESSQELDEVSIMFRKPTLKKESDRLVFNVESSALIEGNIFDVLKGTPGILILNNNIKVKNTTPTVYINDKKVHLNGEELVQLLEGSSANNIKMVEVITNPSSKYDASSGTVINIVMSKNLITGYRGNVFADYTQGVFPRYTAGTSHFFKNEKIDFFGNYSYSQDKENRDQVEKVNYLDPNNAVDEIFNSNVNRNTRTKKHNLNFNLDYAIDDANTLSLASNILVIPYFKYRINNSTKVLDANRNLDYYFDANNFSDDDKYNLGFDLDYVHKFKKEGEKLSINTHFTTFNYDRDQNIESNYFDDDSSFLETTSFRTDNHQDTEIYTAKADYSLPLNTSSTLELGAKGSYVSSNSNINQFDLVNGTETIDLNNTDAFDYDETVFAGYANFSSEWDKWSLVAGLRAEQLNVKSYSVTDGNLKKKNYFEWFPSASINYTLSDNVSVYTNYKRSIQRPNFQSLNPFKFYLNDFNIVTGNPNLQPIIINHAVLGTSLFKGAYTLEAYYKTYSNNIFELPLQDNTNKILTYTPVNLDKTVEFGFDFITYFSIIDSWSVYLVTSFFNTKDQAEFDGILIGRDQWSNYSVLSNDFALLKDRSLNINFSLSYLSKSISGFREVKEILASELSVSKTILKNRGIISLMVSDLFKTQDFKISSRYLNQNSSTDYDQDTRFIKLGFRYKFGNTNLETNQRTKSQQETERLEKKDN